MPAKLKPYQQWWATDGVEIFETFENFEGRKDSLFFTCERLNNEDTPEERQEQARLAACAPEMARMLLAEEYDGGGECVSCREDVTVGHKPSCAWLALMKRAGVR